MREGGEDETELIKNKDDYFLTLKIGPMWCDENCSLLVSINNGKAKVICRIKETKEEKDDEELLERAVVALETMKSTTAIFNRANKIIEKSYRCQVLLDDAITDDEVCDEMSFFLDDVYGLEQKMHWASEVPETGSLAEFAAKFPNSSEEKP